MPRKTTIAASVLAACLIGPGAMAAGQGMNDAQARELFASTCGYCHSDGGRQAGKGPKLAGTQRTDTFIVNRIKQGKEGAMPAFGGSLNDRQIKGIIHYIRNLKSD
jgi:mono/diheme cytochrome c family protein